MRISDEVCVTLDAGGEDIKGFFPSLSDPAMSKAIRTLMRNRMQIRRGGAQDRTLDAREEFFDTTCRRLENVEAKNDAGEYVDVCSMDGWQSRVPLNWKSSFASYFEERAVLNEDDRGN